MSRIVLIVAGAFVAAAFVYFAVRTSSSPATTPTVAFHPTVGDAAATPPASSGSSKPDPASYPMMTAQEERDMRLSIPPEMCTKEGEKINAIAGRPATDPGVLNLVSYCFRLGNVAWARCIDNAKDMDRVKYCSQRFMDW